MSLSTLVVAIVLLMSAPCRFISCSFGERGEATYYNPGVFQRVWEEMSSKKLDPCPDCVGYAALVRNELGKKIWVEYGNIIVGPLYVIDSGNAKHRKQQLKDGLVVDLDYKTGVGIFKMATRIIVTVYRDKPPWERKRVGGPRED